MCSANHQIKMICWQWNISLEPSIISSEYTELKPGTIIAIIILGSDQEHETKHEYQAQYYIAFRTRSKGLLRNIAISS